MVMSNLSDDLWIEIFLRLPFKSLLGSKSVSKSWFSLISSHRFAKSHLALTAKDDDDILIVRHKSGFEDVEEEDGSFSLFHLASNRILKNLKFPYSQGEYPFKLITSELVGSDCGIVCVSVDLWKWTAALQKFDIYLWNPATKHSKLLPPCTITPTNDSGTLGFGFDHVDMDFKVVRVVLPTDCALVCSNLSAEVYSSNTNNWRNIQSESIDSPCEGKYHVLHGFLFAIGLNNTMMAFNLNKEVFICDINLPVNSLDDLNIQTSVTDFKDTVAVMFSILNQGKINLWTLDNETCVCSGGVKASWTKVLSVDLGVPLDSVEGLFNNVHFLQSKSDGHEFNSDSDRFLYNWSEKVTTNVPDHLFLESDQFFKYTKSLFSLVGFKRIKWAASSSRLQDPSTWDE
ncbi:F-box domain-containing protein [Heracleum sosnowskyi]|uniref:F-box domain-containing protein n=1 Tax=Heracleum sosnowskyi TaxID=360622 RepID=A0AAD8MQE9_9APIA|nr:F-box domain-containing protein [Heracleum sosnowskyi]